MEKLTLGWLTLLETPPAEVVSAAAEGGFGAVGIRITGRRLTDFHTPVVGNRAALREIRERLSDGGVRLSNTSIYHLYPEITLDQVLPAFEATAELGANTVIVTCMDPEEARWTAFAAACSERAQAFGITLALEFVPYSNARTLEQGERIVRSAGQPNFGLLVDSLHLARSGGTPAALARVDPELIVFAQLCDADGEKPVGIDLPTEARTGRLYPGEGDLPLHAFLDALPPDTEIELETPRPYPETVTPAERAVRAGDAARRFLKDYRRQEKARAP